ncbi:MAG: bifunctional folylpolyglutamate synthase/dihydrofolate synthase [Ancylobacter novellus]|uniref:Dihydrofolate synthase/folylpolyglutamate synthase n=1 Tax=Ancylobacter novellus TaxID=921 RepID=A0A2W5KUX4_ANCNO|nr:MAG: bifunctional folylpolyglutamate synthase/dihydrofolate synthase [Ancylobacter novellus]
MISESPKQAPRRSDALLARFLHMHPKEIELSLGRMQRLLSDLGHPERRLPATVQVAGTNGKGSTTAFLRAFLEARGLTVHAYTSPHLLRFHERIRLGEKGGGALVTETLLTESLEEVDRINAGRPITFFEITTAAALLLFSRFPANILLLEVGLGGRYDATNVIPSAKASVITSVSLDHREFLGEDVGSIAGEKAGILKTGTPGFIATQQPDALAAIERAAARVGASLHVAGRDWLSRETDGSLLFEDNRGRLRLPLPSLIGSHQIENAGCAIAVARACADWAIEARHIEAGLLRAKWPARMQSLQTGRIAEIAPMDAEIWLDGGHNPDGGRAIALTLDHLQQGSPRPLMLIAGMMRTKDSDGFFEAFGRHAPEVLAVPVNAVASRHPSDVVQSARRAGFAAEAAGSIADALRLIARRKPQGRPRILITGSLHLAGEALALDGFAVS